MYYHQIIATKLFIATKLYGTMVKPHDNVHKVCNVSNTHINYDTTYIPYYENSVMPYKAINTQFYTGEKLILYQL